MNEQEVEIKGVEGLELIRITNVPRPGEAFIHMGTWYRVRQLSWCMHRGTMVPFIIFMDKVDKGDRK